LCFKLAHFGFACLANGLMFSIFCDRFFQFLASAFWFRQFLKENGDSEQPFFIYFATPAPHRPATPEPFYQHYFEDLKAPRTPAFNHHSEDKHWVVRQNPVMNETIINITDDLFRDRLRTLVTTDDTISNVINFLEALGIDDNTFFIFSSDNGYHLGQYSMPGEKRQPYENELRVPLIVKGPGVPQGQIDDSMVLNIDIAPTIIEIAGSSIPNAFDGVSFFKLLSSQKDDIKWRTDFLVEYHGEHGYPRDDGKNHTVIDDCFQEFGFIHDCPNNTFTGLRVLNQTINLFYGKWVTGFEEIYDIDQDPYQLINQVNATDANKLIKLLQLRIQQLKSCRGTTCHSPSLSRLLTLAKQIELGVERS